MSFPLSSELLGVYLHWVHAWQHIMNHSHAEPARLLDIGTISRLFNPSNIKALSDQSLLVTVVTSFQQRFAKGEITVGGRLPPSCQETDLLSANYDPRLGCACDGISPLSSIQDADFEHARACRCIRRMIQAHIEVMHRRQEWEGHGIFTTKRLHAAVEEITFCNMNLQEPPTICSGASITSLPAIEAPDRRPSATCDTPLNIHDAWFPAFEKVKLCADAKHFFVIACGGSLVDEGLLRALADAGNDVLIGDYCEAATSETLRLMQCTGSAAVAFLRACNFGGRISDWQFEILVACHIHFRVLGYYRNHAVSKLPAGLYGSRMTGLTTHRHIDIATTVGIVAASLATGQQINDAEYMKLSRGTTLINDLVDLRSDIMRKQRENPVLRGVRDSACQYLSKQMLDCVTTVRELIESKQIIAMVVMGFCNWAVMSSHHKVYELIHGVTERTELHTCKYDGIEEQYDLLVKALEPFGSLGPGRPHWERKRMDLDKLYSVYRQSPETHIPWLADMVRLLLEPSTFRKIVDVVHFPWEGDIGQVGYCP